MLNTGIISASVEFFGTIICLLELFLFKILIGVNKKSRKFLMLAVASNIVMLVMDILWILYDGKLTTAGLIINRISNYGTFFANAFLISMGTLYIYEIIIDYGYRPSRIFFRIELGLMSCVILMVISNIFYPWIFDFTDENVYYRMSGWYIYTAFIVVSLVAGLVYLLIKRKRFNRHSFWSMITFYGLPIICSVIQAIFGGSYVNLGCSLSLYIIGYVYIKEWIVSNNSEDLSKEKSYRVFSSLFLIMFVCMISALFAGLISLNTTYVSEFESNDLVIAHMVNEAIDGALTKPITVADTMAQSANLRSALLKENIPVGSDEEAELTNYLESIKDGLGYQMAFAASDASRVYYTYQGASKVLRVGEDPHDVWYSDIWNSDQRYVLNVDTDEVNGLTLAVFVNMKVIDNDGKAIGICGVGVPMKTLQELLSSLEDEFNIKIRLINKDGLVQIDSSSEVIENLYLSTDYLDNVTDSDFLLEYSSNRIRMTKYLPDFGWYLVITQNVNMMGSFFNEIMPCIVITLLGILMIFAVFLLFRCYEKAINAAIAEKEKNATIDELTGLYNRYALEKYRNAIHQDDWIHNLAVIVMDLNGLKEMNDLKGHAAGDELLKAAAKCIRMVSDNAYRTGGDEFRIYIENCNKELLSDTLERLKNNFEACKGNLFDSISISTGAAMGSEYPGLFLADLEDVADERMYADKAAYYKRTGKDRRKKY